MAVKSALERLIYTHIEVESYEYIAQITIELYESVNYKSDTLKRMIEYTDKRIKEEQSHYDYWHNLINEIEDDRYRDILIMRYIDDLTVEVVAEKLFYTPRTIARLTNKAISALTQAHSEHESGQLNK